MRSARCSRQATNPRPSRLTGRKRAIPGCDKFRLVPLRQFRQETAAQEPKFSAVGCCECLSKGQRLERIHRRPQPFPKAQFYNPIWQSSVAARRYFHGARAGQYAVARRAAGKRRHDIRCQDTSAIRRRRNRRAISDAPGIAAALSRRRFEYLGRLVPPNGQYRFRNPQLDALFRAGRSGARRLEPYYRAGPNTVRGRHLGFTRRPKNGRRSRAG